MTPEQQAAVKKHVDAIAEILYAETDPATLTNLEAIEKTVRDQLLEQVSPQVGIFLSAALQARAQGERGG